MSSAVASGANGDEDHSTSSDLGGFREEILPSAVDRTLRERADVVGLVNHNSDHPLGRTSARSLILQKDARGLLIDLYADDDISYVADLSRVIQRGDAIGGSFGFRTLSDIWSLRDGTPFREVLDMSILEISVGVVFPAYRGTRLQVGEQRTGRSNEWWQEDTDRKRREIDHRLRLLV